MFENKMARINRDKWRIYTGFGAHPASSKKGNKSICHGAKSAGILSTELHRANKKNR
jgi:hypothetical protein